MTEEPTMATAEEAAQRVYAKKLAADRESKKRKRAEESQEQHENRLAADREIKKRKRAGSQEQHEIRLAAKERKTAQLDENPPAKRESKHIKTENESDDDWVWDFDLDKVINAYQILVKKNKGSAICMS